MSPKSVACWKNIYENENHVHRSPTFRVSIKTQGCVSKRLQTAAVGICSPPPSPCAAPLLIARSCNRMFAALKLGALKAELLGVKLLIPELWLRRLQQSGAFLAVLIPEDKHRLSSSPFCSPSAGAVRAGDCKPSDLKKLQSH